MTAKNAALDERIYNYIIDNTLREEPLLAKLRAETATMPRAGMQIGAEQGQFMALLARAIGAKRYLEIGVFTGYSALVMAQAMGDGSYTLACDVSEEYTAVARRYFREAGVGSRIDLRLAPALQTLDASNVASLPPFDLAFIDADKSNVDAYYERCLELVRPGGIVMIDNVLWNGDVADPAVHDSDTDALRALNAKIGRDARVDCSLLPLCDGLMLARKR